MLIHWFGPIRLSLIDRTRHTYLKYEAAPDCVEALGALNRWPGRTGIPIAVYLKRWEASCAELQASPRLPVRLRKLLRIA
ncbi:MULTISPECIES: hypothetical protein [unclassified Mesorhizobium]|uniref:hypothetical protein n=1 Tax=unclassified Mesorhizobium TaxID=325217 RepID=UPI001091F161|nr:MULTISPECIES: hypothetical protein [unclassified Mesorhizobium]TGU40213.1 hypothetical protein EN799_07290 [bacterium M00.F.Ca.ET.156.01.1.1]TGV14998.1 hypothetical protein EN816_06000 [Mesorhizobium sp. M8A.F.Ca.ET.173.01.1.1]TGQ77110.1 hypothetical protein EN850_29520 [Mesorhizobium sp. M8A.F.Ca.ET.207.01.1.1]TGQ89230.1 hypothetical protein EN851_23475 [Mesorhizobium sp. M8A.F.Ca.ET.208.01.1.1]TGR32334.1 hypothetical protein EN845_07290 [Mesorhizobium sp. M8A.F.Ca.ET.202.01.1.1]